MLRLLRILRDRGSITAEEYDELRLSAEAPETGAPPVAGSVSQSSTAVAVKTPGMAMQPPTATEQALSGRLQAVETQLAKQDPEVAVKKALSNKRDERIGLRGYTQFRGSEVTSEQGAVLEVPADRSANPNESFMIRRGRFIFERRYQRAPQRSTRSPTSTPRPAPPTSRCRCAIPTATSIFDARARRGASAWASRKCPTAG